MLHWPSVAWGAAHLSKREFDEWAEFYKLEPFGPAREDRRAGVIASMLSSNAKPETFFRNLAEDARERDDQSWEEDREQLMALAQIYTPANLGRKHG